MTTTRLTAPGIAEVVSGYLGNQEDDLIFKRPVLQRLFSEAVAAPCLNWEQRPQKVKESVEAAFQKLAQFTQRPHLWATYGKPKYDLCFIDECLLFKTIIFQAYPAQKEFWFVDIGAGDFQCGQGLADYLNSQSDLPKDIVVNIVGLRGERYLEPSVIKAGLCKQIRLGGVKIEDIAKEFDRCQLPKGVIDLALCRITMVHLVDTPGSFAQMHDLLRPGTGILSTDRFSFDLNEEGYNSGHHDQDLNSYLLIQLLLDTGSPFLALRHRKTHGGAFTGLFLKRSGSDPCCLPMRYLPSAYGKPKFVRESPYKNPWKMQSVPDFKLYYYGSKSLFAWLQKSIPANRVFLPLQPLPLESLGLT